MAVFKGQDLFSGAVIGKWRGDVSGMKARHGRIGAKPVAKQIQVRTQVQFASPQQSGISSEPEARRLATFCGGLSGDSDIGDQIAKRLMNIAPWLRQIQRTHAYFVAR